MVTEQSTDVPEEPNDNAAVPHPTAEGFSQHLLDEAPTAVLLSDASGTLLYYNQAAAELHGWQTDVCGQHLSELVFPGPQDARAGAAMAAALEAGRWSGDLSLVGNNGEEFPAFVSWKLLGDRETGLLLGTVQDVSRQKLLEGQLLQAQKMEALGTLAGGMAHEFNNLLASILGASNLAREETAEASELRELIDMVESAGQRGKDLVSQVLSFSRREPPRLEQTQPVEIVADLMRMIRPTLPRGIVIEKEIDRALPEIMADRSRLIHALLNLCVNSADAMGESGTLSIGVRGVQGIPGDDLNQPALPDGDYVCFEVRDNGPGMTESTLRRSLDPFFTTKQRGEGTGLGLPLVKSTAEDLGGSLRLWSTLGAGARIAAFFPVASGEKASPSVESSGQMRDFCGTETVLVVDDEDIVRRVTGRALAKCGYRVLEAADGKEGLEMIAAHPGEVALIVLDMVMPQMGGREFFWELQKANPEIPVLLNSGFSAEGRVGQLLEAGAAGFLPKPYELVDLLRAVRSAIDGTEVPKP